MQAEPASQPASRRSARVGAQHPPTYAEKKRCASRAAGPGRGNLGAAKSAKTDPTALARDALASGAAIQRSSSLGLSAVGLIAANEELAADLLAAEACAAELERALLVQHRSGAYSLSISLCFKKHCYVLLLCPSRFLKVLCMFFVYVPVVC